MHACHQHPHDARKETGVTVSTAPDPHATAPEPAPSPRPALDFERSVFVGTRKGLFRLDRRANGSWRVTGPTLQGWEVTSVWVDPSGRRVLAGTAHFVYGATIRESLDGGETFREIPAGPAYDGDRGLKMNRIWRIEQSRHDSSRFYAGVDEANLFTSTDDGVTWRENQGLGRHETRATWFPGNGGLCLHSIVEHPRDPDRMWVAISAVGAFRTDDGGDTWKVLPDGIPGVPTDAGAVDHGTSRCVHRLVIDERDPDRLFMQYHGGVFRSRDAGDSWHRIERGLPSNFGFPLVQLRDGSLMVIPLVSDEQRWTGNGKLEVYRSADAGESWTGAAVTDHDDPAFTNVLRDAMAVDQGARQGVYFGTTGGDLFASFDGGRAWERLPGHYPRISSVRALAPEG
jgi:photosystem II stability/assembly factor-like uncharacterized protein